MLGCAIKISGLVKNQPSIGKGAIGFASKIVKDCFFDLR